MRQLHFHKMGGLRVAYAGSLRLVIHEAKNAVRAEVYKRGGRQSAPLAGADFSTQAAAIDWLSRQAEPVGHAT